MAKEELIDMMGIVNEVLPDTRFRVTLDNGHKLIAYTGGKMKQEPHPHPRGGPRVAGTLALRPDQGPHHLPPHRRPRPDGAAQAALNALRV